jgi:hypothetical protein
MKTKKPRVEMVSYRQDLPDTYRILASSPPNMKRGTNANAVSLLSILLVIYFTTLSVSRPHSAG